MKGGSLVDFLGDEDKKRLLNYTRASQLPQAKVVIAGAAVAIEAKQPAPTSEPDVCGFVRGYIYGGSDGRRCIDGTYCPSRIYAEPSLFVGCPTRLRKLKEQKEHR